jgi:hypothetical protein
MRTVSPVMLDHARPLKAALLAGRPHVPERIVEINVDHCMAAIAVGLLLGYLLFA